MSLVWVEGVRVRETRGCDWLHEDVSSVKQTCIQLLALVNTCFFFTYLMQVGAHRYGTHQPNVSVSACVFPPPCCTAAVLFTFPSPTLK